MIEFYFIKYYSIYMNDKKSSLEIQKQQKIFKKKSRFPIKK